MASVGRVALSLASGVMETTLALANFNFDFSIIRVDAPAEYRDVGNRLSKRRKKEAEQGKIHATARKLGALFADVVPQVPNLEKAYGLRASEIVANPTVNPEASAVHGALQGYVGLDATTVWAAATSGRGAIQVHLLACLLARQWSASQAIAIWSELVSTRKSHLEAQLQDDQFHLGHLMAAQIDIELTKLAEWDASARAWLHAADKVFTVQQKQLMLIVDNLDRALTSMDNVYNNVHKIWCNALQCMEKIASGMSLSVESPEIFLGLSSWHLYPDMIILGKETKSVSQKDNLIPPGALVTVGMQKTKNQKEVSGMGISWTIPLARLKYYGRPTVSTSVMGTGSSRAPFERCVQIALGSLISTWGLAALNLSDVFKFFIAFNQRCILESQITGNMAQSTPHYPGWTHLFAELGRSFARAREKEQQDIAFYVNLGRRRYHNFINENFHFPPFFGMSNAELFLTYLDVEDQVSFFRDLATKYNIGIDLSNAIIFYKNRRSLHGEIASVFPNQFVTSDQIAKQSHRRWILIRGSVLEEMAITAEGHLDMGLDDPTYTDAFIVAGKHSIDIMEATAEPCGFIPKGTILDRDNKIIDRPWLMDNSPPMFLKWTAAEQEVNLVQLKSALEVKIGVPISRQNLSGWQLGSVMATYENTKFRLVCNSFSAALYAPVSEWKPITVIPPLNFISDLLPKLQPDEVIINKLITKNSDNEPAVTSLEILHRAALIYSTIPTATVDLRVASKPLHEARWSLGEEVGEEVGENKASEAFACIAMFDSGVYLTPSDCTAVMALSSRDVIYVSAALLDFPVEDPSKICLVVGNIGKPGLSLLISPSDLDIRDSEDDWQLINHAEFDGKPEDNFRSTSLHLNLTGSETPLNVGIMGSRFTEATYVEACVRAYDRGGWFADIDVLGFYTYSMFGRTWLAERLLPSACDHEYASWKDFPDIPRVTSIDNWPEMIEPPSNTSVIRARGNWSARLALASSMRARNHDVVIAGDVLCWQCAKKTASYLRIPLAHMSILL